MAETGLSDLTVKDAQAGACMVWPGPVGRVPLQACSDISNERIWFCRLMYLVGRLGMQVYCIVGMA